MKTTTIKPEVMDVLRTASVSGNNVVLNSGQLDRKLYVEVNKVLTELGGKWNTKAKAHIFGNDPQEIFNNILNEGKLQFAKDLGYFPTPRKLAEFVVELAELYPRCSVLEPSAGTGDLAEAIEDAEPTVILHCYEINPKFISVLEDKGFNSGLVDRVADQEDFLNIEAAPLYNRAVMNPPFDKSQTEIDHVMHAWDCLADEGILVSILPTGVIDRTNSKSRLFQDFLESRGAEIHRNEDGAFKESGTMVNTITIKVRKD